MTRPHGSSAVAAMAAVAALALGMPALTASIAGAMPFTASSSTLTISPGHVTAASTGNNLTLTFTAASNDSGRTLAVTFPSGFSAPQSTNGSGAGFVSIAPGTCSSAGLSSVSGQVVTAMLTCAPGQTATIGWVHVTAPTTANPYPFSATEGRAAGVPKQTLANPQPLIVDAGPAKKLKASVPSTFHGGCQTGITVWAIDQYKNLATGYAGTVSIHSDDPHAVLPAPYTFTVADAGEHVLPIVLTLPNSVTYTVSDTSGTKAFNGSTNVVSPTSIGLSPANGSVQVGGTVQYAATANFFDGTSCDITHTATYTSSKPTVATISSNGKATGVGLGTTVINATDGQTINGTNLTTVQATTTTGVVSSENPSNFGDSVTFTATVTSSTSSAPTGTVTFADGGVPLAPPVSLSGTTAACTTAALTGGTHSITATYNGDTNHSTSVGSLSQVVDPVATSTVASASGDGGAGDPVTLTAVVAPAAGTPPAGPTGTVTFYVDGNPVGSGTLDGTGTATFDDSGADFATGATVYNITATYAGDANFTGSSGATTYTTD